MVLRRQNAVLRARVQALRLIIQDMSGPAIDLDDDDPYEDEQPMVREREEDE
jgi:hypothetical protein